jgi:signal transduction histidine kinase
MIGTTAGAYLGSFDTGPKGFSFSKPLLKFSSVPIICIYKDRSDDIWISECQRGIIHLAKTHTKIIQKNISIDFLGKKINDLSINSFNETKKGEIILGTDLGLFLFNPKTKSIKPYEKQTPNDILKRKNTNLTFFEKTLWSSRSFDVSKFNEKTKSFERFFSIPPEISKLDLNMFNAVAFKDTIGWFASENGLYAVNLVTGKLKIIIGPSDTFDGLTIYMVRSIAADPDGDILIATSGGGLIVYTTKTEKKIFYQHDANNPYSISSNYIRQLIVAKSGDIWLCTNNGLEKFDKKRGRFTHFNTNNGFPSNFMMSAVEDDKGNLWITNEMSISKFNPVTAKLWNYNFYNPVNQNIFINRSVYKAANGYLYFGCTGNFVYFHPDSVSENKKGPSMLFTNFKINNESVLAGKDSPLGTNIEDAKEVILNYKQSSFSFSFAALNYTYPEKNRYVYKLNNFDKDWINGNNNNTANYTNIPAGNYTFMVKSSDEDGIWNNDGISIKVIVLPAYWEHWYFRVSVFLLVGMVIALLYAYKIRQVKAEQIKLEKIVRKRTAQLLEANAVLKKNKKEIEEQKEEIGSQRDDLARHQEHLEIMVMERTRDLEKALRKAEENDALKSSFLANMSHEIRTPLNAIVGFSSLLNSTSLSLEKREKYFNVIQSNSDALLVLINDILDLSKIEAGQIEMNLSGIQAGPFIREVLDTFTQNLILNEIELRITIPAEMNDCFVKADPVRLRQIFNNLLSNAIKFTNRGFVEIGCLYPENEYVTFYVKDTGIGIEPQYHSAVFERFRKIESDSVVLYRGTGLGLAITKKLTQLMGGKIWLESEVAIGSTFYFTIPLL